MSHKFMDYESSDGLSRHAHLAGKQTRPVKQVADEDLAFSLAEEERILEANLVPAGAIEQAEQDWDFRQTARARETVHLGLAR